MIAEFCRVLPHSQPLILFLGGAIDKRQIPVWRFWCISSGCNACIFHSNCIWRVSLCLWISVSSTRPGSYPSDMCGFIISSFFSFTFAQWIRGLFDYCVRRRSLLSFPFQPRWLNASYLSWLRRCLSGTQSLATKAGHTHTQGLGAPASGLSFLPTYPYPSHHLCADRVRIIVKVHGGLTRWLLNRSSHFPFHISYCFF